MTYGDGDGVNYGPLVSLDVAGHEMSHGVTENTAGLTYSGESGGLNEATSDIFGTMVEFFAEQRQRPGRLPDRRGVRPQEPRGLPPHGQPDPDGSRRTAGARTRKNLDVHYSSGVGNHFFYLLAEGSGAKTINGVAHNSPDLQRLDDHRHRPRRRAEDLVPRADGLHDVGHELRAGPDGHAERGARPVRRRRAPAHTVAAAWSAVSVADGHRSSLRQPPREGRPSASDATTRAAVRRGPHGRRCGFAADEPDQRGGERRAEDDDEERRAQEQQHHGGGQPGSARVEHQPVAGAEDLDRDQRGEQGDRDQVGDPATSGPLEHPRAAPTGRPA